MTISGTNSMYQIKSHITASGPFRTICIAGKSEFHIIQFDVIFPFGPIVEIIFNGEFLWQISTLLLDERSDDSIISYFDSLYTTMRFNLCITIQQIPL